MLQSFSLGGPGRPPASIGSEQSSVGPPGSSISPLNASSPPCLGHIRDHHVLSQPLGAPPARLGTVHSRPSVDLRRSQARPTRNFDVRPPTDPGRGSHHRSSAPVGGIYSSTRSGYPAPCTPPSVKMSRPGETFLPRSEEMLSHKELPQPRRLLSHRWGTQKLQGGPLPQVVMSPHTLVKCTTRTRAITTLTIAIATADCAGSDIAAKKSKGWGACSKGRGCNKFFKKPPGGEGPAA